jgi:hypothetical protein
MREQSEETFHIEVDLFQLIRHGTGMSTDVMASVMLWPHDLLRQSVERKCRPAYYSAKRGRRWSTKYIARRTKSLSRENFGTRIQALREITGLTFAISKDDLDKLKRLSNIRNAIVHEGTAFQFTVDDDLRVHSQAETQKVTMGTEDFGVISRIAASIYRDYVTQFAGRELHVVERVALVHIAW